MYRLIIVVLPFLLILSQRLAAQAGDTNNKILSGKIVDDSLGLAVPFVHLWNESTRTGGISNDSGVFHIKIRNQDTIIFSSIGYFSEVVVASGSSMDQYIVVRLKPQMYEIGEVVVRRFSSYASFINQVVNLDLSDSKTEYLREHIKLSATNVAIEADRERAAKDKLNGFGYSTPLGRGISREKASEEKINNIKMRKQIINEKFNRELVRDITHLDGDELTEFIALCDFSEDYLYEADLYTIIEALYVKLNAFQNMKDTVPPVN
jgi:hypothetical protein